MTVGIQTVSVSAAKRNKLNTRRGGVKQDWPYRLGDMIRFHEQRAKPHGAEYHIKKFPDSIASKYLQSLSDDCSKSMHELNLEALVGIINKFPKNIEPNDNELVVHLRIGDIFRFSNLSIDEILDAPSPIPENWDPTARSQLNKTLPLSFYQKLSLSSRQAEVTLLIGSLDHNPKPKLENDPRNDKSRGYVYAIKDFFEESGYKVNFRHGFSPDEDFVFACRAKMFIPSNSGFAIVAEEVRKYLGYESYS